MKKPYEPIEHTADFGLKIYGGTLKELFENAAAGMFKTITDTSKVKPRKKISVRLTAEEIEELLVSWLRELLYQFNAKKNLFCKFIIQKVAPDLLIATASGEPYNPKRHKIKSELKAVTYHGLYVKNTKDGWETQVIFDR